MENIIYNEVENYKTLRELLIKSAEKFGESPAFKQKVKGDIIAFSYKQFKEDVFAFGTTLKNFNLLDKNIGIIGETSYEWICAYFAISCGGGVVVPIDKEATDEEIKNILVASESAALIYSATYEPTKQKLMVELTEITDFVCLQDGYFKWLDMGRKEIEMGDTSYNDIVIDPQKISAILYTSGTTGKSKGVMLTNQSIMAAAEGALNLLEFGDTCLSVLPVHHSYEFTHGIVMMLERGVCICINESLRYFVQNLQLYKPTHVCVVPLFVEMMYNKIWQSAREAGIDNQLRDTIKKSNELFAKGIDKREEFFANILAAFGGRLRLILCGGSPLTADLMRSMREFGMMVVNGYGITECSPLVAVNSNKIYKDGTVGVPIGCTEVKTLNLDENGHGDVWVKGKNVMLGYHKNPEVTAQVIVDEWFDTGDIGYIDEDGFLSITGRRKNLIVLNSGKNVYPEDVEEYYKKIPYIKEIVVYSRLKDDIKEMSLSAEVFIDENYSKDFNLDEMYVQLKKDVSQINKMMPLYKQVNDFNIRDKEFEKTTKKSIMRFKI